MSLAILMPLIAQLGPGGELPQAPLDIRRPPRETRAAPQPQALAPQLSCLELAAGRPDDALIQADSDLARAGSMAERAAARRCRGLALVEAGRLGDAAQEFLAARDETPLSDAEERTRLAAMAGNAWQAASVWQSALDAFDLALRDLPGGAAALGGEIEIDRARALVALGRSDEARGALARARARVPGNAQAWLLSATLERRQGDLDQAQALIEKAAQLAPADPETGLEAGVIAVLAGRDEAARKSWLSVIAAAPATDAARTAQRYLDQLGTPAAQAGR